jgi:hypothetical protein
MGLQSQGAFQEGSVKRNWTECSDAELKRRGWQAAACVFAVLVVIPAGCGVATGWTAGGALMALALSAPTLLLTAWCLYRRAP